MKLSKEQEQKELIEMAADQFARLFWRQIQYEHQKRKQMKYLPAPSQKEDEKNTSSQEEKEATDSTLSFSSKT